MKFTPLHRLHRLHRLLAPLHNRLLHLASAVLLIATTAVLALSDKRKKRTLPQRPTAHHDDTNKLSSAAAEQSQPFDKTIQLAAFEHQIAGHVGLSNEGGQLLVPEPGKIAKPVGIGYFAGEDNFYSLLSATPELAAFCPRFFGRRVYSGRTFVVLEDLTKGMRTPCIVDIKVGTTTVATDAHWAKRVTHLAKDRESTTRSLGVRIIGAMHSGVERGAPPTLRLNKVWGRAVRPTQMRAALRRVFSVEGQLCTTALRHYVSMLERLMSVLETQPYWQLVSSSLLFVFEKEAARGGSGGSDGCAMPPQMRMIDFAHSYPLEHAPRDHGYLFGLRNLYAQLRGLLDADEASDILSSTSACDSFADAAAETGADAESDATDAGAGRYGLRAHSLVVEQSVGSRIAAAHARLASSQAAGCVALHADELFEGLSNSELSYWLPEWLGFASSFGSHDADFVALPDAVPATMTNPPQESIDVALGEVTKRTRLRCRSLRYGERRRTLSLWVSAPRAGTPHQVLWSAARQAAAAADAEPLGRSVDLLVEQAELVRALAILIGDEPARRRRELLETWALRLEELARALRRGAWYQFGASRLLLVYQPAGRSGHDGGTPGDPATLETPPRPPGVCLSNVERASMTKTKSCDMGFLVAIESLCYSVRSVVPLVESLEAEVVAAPALHS